MVAVGRQRAHERDDLLLALERSALGLVGQSNDRSGQTAT
jgi:hypothetical protein